MGADKYEWDNVTVTIDGKPLIGIKGITIDDLREVKKALDTQHTPSREWQSYASFPSKVIFKSKFPRKLKLIRPKFPSISKGIHPKFGKSRWGARLKARDKYRYLIIPPISPLPLSNS